METKFIVCSHCRSRLRVPATLPAGKKVKCPKCSQLVMVPAPAADDSGFEVVRESPAPASQPPTTLAPAMKSCPYCGEQVLANAVKCRHCGEFFDAKHGTAAARTAKAIGSKDELNPAEYVVALLFAPVGIVIGLVWKLKNVSKANDMLKVSGLSSAIVLVIGLLAYFYVFKDRMNAMPSGPGSPTITYSRPPTYSDGYDPFNPLQQPPTITSVPQDNPPDLAELEQQPPEIRRAMKANVRIAQTVGVGSGVIVRRDGGKALILTNRHVVDLVFALTQGLQSRELKDLEYPKVTYVTREDHPGKVLWLAPDMIDLALIEAPCPESVEAVPWQASDEIQIGEQVFAVGNPAGLGWTYTRGVVSALRQHGSGPRQVPVVQTDTRIGPGNSGGGLYNQKGELIGINTYVVSSSRSTVGETGLGFAIRKNILTDLHPEVLQPTAERGNP